MESTGWYWGVCLPEKQWLSELSMVILEFERLLRQQFVPDELDGLAERQVEFAVARLLAKAISRLSLGTEIALGMRDYAL
jgi:hypothetical protein